MMTLATKPKTLIVLIDGAVDSANKQTAERVRHALLNNGISCESRDLAYSWATSAKFADDFRSRQKIRADMPPPQVVLMYNHPAVMRGASSDGKANGWADITLRPHLAFRLEHSRVSWAHNLNRRPTTQEIEDFGTLSKRFSLLTRLHFGAMQFRTIDTDRPHGMLLASGQVFRWILFVLEKGLVSC